MLAISRPSYAISLTHGASVTTATAAVPSDDYKLNGLLYGVVVLTPAAVDGGATCTISIQDTDALTVYTGTAHAANGKFYEQINNPVALAKVATITATFSANQTATDSVTNVRLLVKH